MTLVFASITVLLLVAYGTLIILSLIVSVRYPENVQPERNERDWLADSDGIVHDREALEEPAQPAPGKLAQMMERSGQVWSRN